MSINIRDFTGADGKVKYAEMAAAFRAANAGTGPRVSLLRPRAPKPERTPRARVEPPTQEELATAAKQEVEYARAELAAASGTISLRSIMLATAAHFTSALVPPKALQANIKAELLKLGSEASRFEFIPTAV